MGLWLSFLKQRKLMAATLSLLSDFLVQEELKQENPDQDILLKRVYRKKRLSALYLAALEKEKKELTKSQQIDFYNYQDKVRLQHEFYFYVGANKYAEKDPLNALANLHQDLDVGYLLAKLHYACQVLVIQRFRGASVEVAFIEEAIIMANHPEIKEHAILQLYIRMIRLLQDRQVVEYSQIKEEVLASLPLVNKEIRGHLLVLLLNLTWLTVERPRIPEFTFELYKFGLENDILRDNGMIGTSHFNNIVDIGCSLGEFEYTRTFIKNYLPYLESKEGSLEHVKTLFEAFLYFGEGNFEKVLQHLNYLEFKDLSYGIRAYLLMIKSTYETKKAKSYKEVDMLCEAFRQYIKRKYKQGYMSELVREENLNFIKIASLLPNASSSNFAIVPIKKLKDKLLTFERVVSRTWLEAKINEL